MNGGTSVGAIGPVGAEFVESLHDRAALSTRSILFPESHDFRTVEAIIALLRRGSVRPVMVRRSDATTGVMPSGKIEIIDPLSDRRADEVAALLVNKRGGRGMTPQIAYELSRSPLYFANGLVALGYVDGCVAGAATTTSDVVRSALWTIGVAPGITTVSSAFYMVVPAFRNDGPEVLTFTDCGVVQSPTSRQLADIAVAAALDRRLIVGDEPRIAFLSHSSLGSAAGDDVNRVREAVLLVQTEHPDLKVAGELQADAALMPEVARRKAPGEKFAGSANVLVFPSLDAGNIAYKLVQRLAHAKAFGPILQGLAKPCCDLSRGATSDDIVHVAAIAALQVRQDEPNQGHQTTPNREW